MSDSTRAASELVRHVIERDPVVKKGLARGLINVRALGREIYVSVKREVSFEAIISAIRRYPHRKPSDGSSVISGMITKLSMKNHMVIISLRNTAQISMELARFSAEVDYEKGETLRIVCAPEVITLVIDSKNLEKLTSKIPEKYILEITRNLAEIVINHPTKIVRVPGIVAAITTEVALNGVNMLNCTGTYGPPPQITIVVEEKDATKTYQALENLSQPD